GAWRVDQVEAAECQRCGSNSPMGLAGGLAGSQGRRATATMPNPSLQPTCDGLRPPHAAELKREAAPSPRASGVFWRLTDMRIQPYDPEQLEAVVCLALRAWTPVFELIQKVMDVDVYRELHPDWRVSQQKAVEGICAAEDTKVWVAIDA